MEIGTILYQRQSHLLKMWIAYMCLVKCYQVEFSNIFWNWCQILQLREIKGKYIYTTVWYAGAPVGKWLPPVLEVVEAE